jgi:cytochrome c oxidase subunit IV
VPPLPTLFFTEDGSRANFRNVVFKGKKHWIKSKSKILRNSNISVLMDVFRIVGLMEWTVLLESEAKILALQYLVRTPSVVSVNIITL